MRIWVVKDMEPLPVDPGNRRGMRSAMLCRTLAERGHEVNWITSSFDHYAKRQRSSSNETHLVSDCYRIDILRSPGYRRNISPSRLWHNRCFARAFLEFAGRSDHPPDVMVTDVPTTETAQAVVSLGQRWGVPTLLSIRDIWPDSFKDFVYPPARSLASVVTKHLERQVTKACRGASAIVGISPGYLEWGLTKAGRTRQELDGVVPLGYEPVSSELWTGQFAARELHGLGVDVTRPIVSFVGSWGATYDLELVLDVAELLADRSDAQFVLAGDGDNRNRLLGRIERLRNVVAPGWLTEGQIALLLENTSIGLMPYRKAAPQGLPNKIFEYMAYGAFQVSTLHGEAAELLARHDVGITVSGGPQDLADVISEVLTNPGASVDRERIRREFHTRYTAKAVYGDLSERIERLGPGRW